MEKYEIIISSKAQEDILTCVGFVKNVSLEAAKDLFNNLYDFIESLETFPERNPLFEMPQGTNREIRKGIVEKRYIVLYEIEKQIIVHRVIDSRKGFEQLII